MRLSLVLLLYSACVAAAQFPAAADRYTGRWNVIAAECDNIDSAIEATIKSLSFVVRPIARMKLKRRNVAFPHFDLSRDDKGLRLRHEKGLDVTYPAVDTAVKTRAPDGTDVIARVTLEPVLLFSYEADSGRREDTYILSADGSKLTMMVRLTSSNLPKPLTYRLVYRRQP